MSDQSTAYKVLFADNIKLLAQQKNARLVPCVMVDNDFKGERKTYDQLSTIDPVEIMSRDQDTPSMQPDHRRRNVFPRQFVTNLFADKADVYQMVSNPNSAYMMASVAGQKRKQDDIIIAAFNATAYTGKNGTSTQTFTAANQVAVTVGPGTARWGGEYGRATWRAPSDSRCRHYRWFHFRWARQKGAAGEVRASGKSGSPCCP